MKNTYTPLNQANSYEFESHETSDCTEIPGDHLIRNIMNYSKALELHYSGNSEIVRIILN